MPTEKLIVIVENKSKTIKPPTEGAKINVKIAGIYGVNSQIKTENILRLI